MDPKESKIKEIISRIIKVRPDQIENDDDLVDKHGMDSMARIEIMTELEKEFDVTIDDNEALQLRSVHKCVEILNKLSTK